MYFFSGIMLIILGGILGEYLDSSKKMKEPVNFYFIGELVGMIAMALILK